MSAQSRFLRTQQAARFLGLSPRTVEKHRINGTGPKYSKIGGRIIYAMADLEKWVELGIKKSTGGITILERSEIIAADAKTAQHEQLDTREAARFLGLSRRTVEKYRTDGTGPKHSKVGGRFIYAISDLREWVELSAKRSTARADRKIPPEHGDMIAKVRTARPAGLDTREAARFLELSYRRLEKHRIYGTGPKYSKVGHRILYAINDLKEWAQSKAKRPTSDSNRTPVRPANQSISAASN
jgi:predicted DNA-binding transcriptional regulator AlpA